MGRKIHPKAFRLGVIRPWDASWFAKKPREFSRLLQEDVRMREFLMNELKDALVDRIEIERSRQKVTIHIFAGKPGIIIGRAGSGIEELNKKLKKRFFRGQRVTPAINVKEVKKISLSSRIVAQQIAVEIEKRMPFRRSMKQAIERVMKAGAKGVKVTIAGRLNGAEIARSETISKGSIPLHNLRSDIDYAQVEASTVYGVIGVKVWVNRGEVFDDKKKKSGKAGEESKK
jgi:small subunit ribosomal protein S3